MRSTDPKMVELEAQARALAQVDDWGPQAARVNGQMVQLGANYPSPYMRLARCREQNGDYGGMSACYVAAQQRQPNPTQSRIIDSGLERARTWLASAEELESLRAIQDPAALYAVGRASRDARKHALAAEAFRLSAERAHDDDARTKALLSLGSTYRRWGRPDLACTTLRPLVTSGPGLWAYASATSAIIAALCDMDELDEATRMASIFIGGDVKGKGGYVLAAAGRTYYLRYQRGRNDVDLRRSALCFAESDTSEIDRPQREDLLSSLRAYADGLEARGDSEGAAKFRRLVERIK